MSLQPEAILVCPQCKSSFTTTLNDARLGSCYLCPHCGKKWCDD